jgi:hyperosmotically inducible protein
MKFTKLFLPAMLCTFGFTAIAQEPDNTKTNRQDSPTADQQKNNVADRDLTKKIRQSIMSDKALSTYAHNVKIISQNGLVTLKGPVRSEDEKTAIEAKALEVVGDKTKISNQMSVKPQQ